MLSQCMVVTVESLSKSQLKIPQIFIKPVRPVPQTFSKSRVYAQNKKEETFGRIEILLFCSNKRVCANFVLEEFPLFKY